MKALAFWLRWRLLCLLLAPVQLLTSVVVRAMRWLATAADDAEVEMLLATVEHRIAAKRRRGQRTGAGGQT